MLPPAHSDSPPNIFSLCSRPPWAIAALEFQTSPTRLKIGRVREDNRRLFEKLDGESCQLRRGEIFHEYLSVQFALHQWTEFHSSSRSSLRNSYIRFFRGWQMDSNSPEGAVLKGWVESRMGLRPTFHGGSLARDSEAAARYRIDRVRGSARTNAIDLQLDLLYEFCQYELARRHTGERWLTLFRGTFDADSYEQFAPLDNRRAFVCLNSLSSFTSDRECAWEFGSTVWEVRVPLSKIFFFGALLPASLLKGEDEFLVIGGEYRVQKLLF